jgi:hypothetical protein
MYIGTQIFAPDGWQQLPKGVKFYFLRSDHKRGRVLLAHFVIGNKYKGPKAHLTLMSRKIFEEGAGSDKIIPCENQSLLPPWLESFSGVDLSQADRFRPNPKILHSTRVEDRFLHIAPTVRDFESILAANNPEGEINRRAQLCAIPQNETRFRLWVLTYLCFGQDMWMLFPAFPNIGHWDRFEYPNKKFGARSIAFGASYGYGSSQELSEQCVKSYLKRAMLGKRMTVIYDEAMTEDFCCRIDVNPSGMKSYVSQNGKPFPTFWQFVYRVKEAIGIESIQRTLYGEVRHRARIAASKGSFTEEVANLMERVEADGYYTKERPKGYIEGTSLPPLCVVIGRDILSGKKLGIGFSFGSESGTAYRMMLFCMAVPKDFFCKLFGIPFVPGEWVNEGLPGHFSIDRGPGARKDLIEDIEKRFPIKGLAPSWMAQTKANIESSHPRDVKIEGQPTYIKSNFTPIELAKREIMGLMRFNHTANMEDRFDPDSELALVAPSPIGLWNHYDKLFRNDAVPISIEEAVRTFLTPIEFSLREDGVWLDQRRFDTDELRETGILERVARTSEVGTKINGYILDMCIRHIWVEVDGRLLMLDAVLRIRGDEETLNLSFEELKQWNEARRTIRSAFMVHQHAASSEYMYRFKENTGKVWDSSKRCSGKPKRDVTARQEEADARQSTSGRKAA